MPVISQTLIQKPRKQRKCAECGRMIEGPQHRLYGSAHESDPKYVLYQHADPEVCKERGTR